MKIIGVIALSLGLALLVFATMAYSELRAAATSDTPPSPNSMSLTKIISPELFDPGYSATKPADLARAAMNRIYVLGGLAVVLFVGGAFSLFAAGSPKHSLRDSALNGS